MSKSPVVGLAIADLHLSHRPPIMRSGEPDWYEAQERYLKQVRELQYKYQCPLLIAGDLFDDGWRVNRCPVELVNFAIRRLRSSFPIYAIPGNHDLPHHRYDDVNKSAYSTMALAKTFEDVITDSPEQYMRQEYSISLFGFPYSVPPVPNPQMGYPTIDIALVHDYCWVGNCRYDEAPEDKRAKNFVPLLKGYHLAIFGDNHIPFEIEFKKSKLLIYNCGALIPRRWDERNHCPSVGLIRADGTVDRHYLDTSKDIWLEKPVAEMISGIGFEGLIESLADLGQSSIDFHSVVHRLMERKKTHPDVKKIVTTYLEGVQP